MVNVVFEQPPILESKIHSIENCKCHRHGLQTPNEGINQRNLKFWADMADKNMLRQS